MNIPYTLIFCAVIVLTGCSSANISEYAGRQPSLDLFEYFSGSTRGWGIVQDRGGRLTRQFTVDIVGRENQAGDLVLEEDFNWYDGERSRRVWTISKKDRHVLVGSAPDVVGEAAGSTYGSVLNWRYVLALEVDGSIWNIAFDDWMFLHSDGVLLNRAMMSKFGFRVGEVTIAFQKQPETT